MNTTHLIKTIGMDLVPPYWVYANGAQVREHATCDNASAHYNRLRLGLMSPDQRQREKDKTRTAMQSPISSTKFRIFYSKNQIEHKSPWFYRAEHAQKALGILKAKYGEDKAIIYRD